MQIHNGKNTTTHAREFYYKGKKNSKVEIQLFNGHTAKPALPGSGN